VCVLAQSPIQNLLLSDKYGFFESRNLVLTLCTSTRSSKAPFAGGKSKFLNWALKKMIHYDLSLALMAQYLP